MVVETKYKSLDVTNLFGIKNDKTKPNKKPINLLPINYAENIKNLIDSCNNNFSKLTEINNEYNKKYYVSNAVFGSGRTHEFTKLFNEFIKSKTATYYKEKKFSNDIDNHFIELNKECKKHKQIIDKLNSYKDNIIDNLDDIKKILTDIHNNLKETGIENDIKNIINGGITESNQGITESNQIYETTFNMGIYQKYKMILKNIAELQKQGGRNRKTQKTKRVKKGYKTKKCKLRSRKTKQRRTTKNK